GRPRRTGLAGAVGRRRGVRPSGTVSVRVAVPSWQSRTVALQTVGSRAIGRIAAVPGERRPAR
ncbi:hypothetical protein, partial [Streptomyces sp. H28]|uniref:hypothetical protein n=1 Tax=Streptomyces sp. H28 TaxID=2775865 RepID=UPI001CE034C4